MLCDGALARAYPLRMDDKAMGASMRRHRERAGKTQGQVADYVGVTPQQIAHLEKGRRAWRVEEYLYPYAEAVGCAVVLDVAKAGEVVDLRASPETHAAAATVGRWDDDMREEILELAEYWHDVPGPARASIIGQAKGWAREALKASRSRED